MQEVLVGNKPAMNYVVAVMTHFGGGAREVTIKARGKSISKAVDVAEMIRNRFLTGVKLKEIKIGTDSLQTKEGEKINVSTIEIILTK